MSVYTLNFFLAKKVMSEKITLKKVWDGDKDYDEGRGQGAGKRFAFSCPPLTSLILMSSCKKKYKNKNYLKF